MRRETQLRTSGTLHPDLSTEVVEHDLPPRPGFRSFGSGLYIGSKV